MTPPRVLLVHSGHSFSVTDVYDGLLWGLTDAGADVVEYRWDQSMQIFSALVMSAVKGGLYPDDAAEPLIERLSLMAGSDLVVAAMHHEVDAVLVVNGLLIPPQRIAVLTRGGVPTACYGTEAPYMADAERAIAPAYTHWFTQERRSVGAYDVPMTYLPLAYHPERHRPGPADPAKAVDVAFVGGGYPERKRLLNGVDWSGISFARRGTLWHLDLDAAPVTAPGTSGRGSTYTAGNIPNAETAAWHRSAAISLNIHRRMTYVETRGEIRATDAESCNPRVYEIPAVGGFLLCDDSRPELFDILGDSAATFAWGDSADLERQIRHWLTHPDRRDAVRRAQAAAIAPHHYGARARTILEALL